jgi:hypothetical protein
LVPQLVQPSPERLWRRAPQALYWFPPLVPRQNLSMARLVPLPLRRRRRQLLLLRLRCRPELSARLPYSAHHRALSVLPDDNG